MARLLARPLVLATTLALLAASLVTLTATPAVAAPTAAFDWRMPERFGLDQDGDRLVDYRQSADDLDFLFPDSWPVILDACGSSPGGADIATYAWQVVLPAGTESIPASPDCQAEFSFPAEGTYEVTVTVTDTNDDAASHTADVVVEDLLIVSVGDSIASGEGNPDKVEPNFGFNPTAPTWQNERCHRSALAGSARAPLRLEHRDPHTSVTFVHLACSGATILEGLLGPYAGIDEDGDNDDPTDADDKIKPQLEQLHDLLVAPPIPAERLRAVDALEVSIGANDLEFSGIVKACLALATCYDVVDPSIARDGQDIYDENIVKLNGPHDVTWTDPVDGDEETVGTGNYGALAKTLADHFVAPNGPIPSADRIFLTEYFDPTTGDDFDPANPGDGDPTTDDATGYCDVPEIGLLRDESEWAHATVVAGLNAQVAAAASSHGWTFVAGIAEDFLTHGYCARDRWTRTLEETFAFQGGPDGSFHPNSEGHNTGDDGEGRTAVADHLEDALAATFGITAPKLPPPSDLTAMDIAAGLGSATELLDQVDGLAELAKAPGISDAADFTSNLLSGITGFLGDVQTAVTGTAHRSIGALESFLDDPDGNGDLADDGSFDGVTIDSEATILPDGLSAQYQVQWRVTAARSTPVPLSAEADPDGDGPSGPITLDGADLQADYAFEMNVGFRFDPTAASGERFALLTSYPDLTPAFEQPGGGPTLGYIDPTAPIPAPPPPPTVTSGIRLESELAADLGLLPDLRLGVITVDVTGNASASLAARVGFVDPGTGDDADGRITQAEWEGTADATTLFGVQCISPNTPEAGDHPGSQASLSATLGATLPGTTDAATGTFTLTDTDLCDATPPVVDLALGELGNFGQFSPEDLVELLLNIAISLGSVENLGDLELPFLQGRLTVPVTDPATGDIVRPALVDLDGHLNDFLLEDFGDGPYATDPDDILGSLDRDKLATTTLEGFLDDLRSYLGLNEADFGLVYDAPTDRLTFQLAQTLDPDPATADLSIGETLSPLGIAATGEVGAAVDAQVGFDAGVVFDLSSITGDTQPDLRERILLDLAGDELVVDAPVTANVDTTAQLGFLQVQVSDGSTPAEDHVPVLQGIGTSPMFSVDVDVPSPISLSDLATALSPDTGSPPVATDVQIEVPSTSLSIGADLSGTPVGPCGVTLAWADVTTGTPQVTPTDTCFTDTFASFGFGDDPRALFAVVVGALRDLLGQVDTLTDAGSPLRAELPLVGGSIADVITVVPDALAEVEAVLTADGASHLQALEVELEAALAEAVGLPPNAGGGLLSFAHVPGSGGTGGGTLVLRADLGSCSTGVADPGGVCDVTHDGLSEPFNLDFDIPGGIAGLEAGGTLTVDHLAHLVLEVEIDLPEDPTSGALPAVFVDTDQTQLTLAVETGLEAAETTSLAANVGPAEVRLGIADADGDTETTDPDPIVAHLAAEATLANATGRVPLGGVGAWVGGLLPDPAADPGAFDGVEVDCDPDPPATGHPACAHIPVYLTTGATPTHLGDIEFAAPDLLDPDGWTFDGAQAILDQLASEEFLWAMLADGFRALAGTLADTLRASSYDLELPIVGDALDGGAAIADQIEGLADEIATLATELGPLSPEQLEGHIASRLAELVGPTGLLGDVDGSGGPTAGDVQVVAVCGGLVPGPCTEDHAPSEIVDVEIRLRLGQSAQPVSLSTDGFDLGLTGLRMQAAPGQDISVTSDWSLDLGFGMSDAEGFYVTTEGDGTVHADDTELTVGTSMALPTALEGEVAFVPFTLSGAGPDATLQLDVDLAGGSGGRLTLAALQSGPDPQDPSELTAALCGGIDLDRTLSVGGAAMGDAALPRVYADFGIAWQFAECGVSTVDPTGFSGSGFEVEFDAVMLDLGSVVDEFLEPLLGDVLKYVGPIRPIIDELYAPIPLVSHAMDVIGVPQSEWPTWIDLLKQVGDNDLEMLDRIAEVSAFLDTLEGVSAGGDISLGEFVVDGAAAVAPPVPEGSIGTLVQPTSTNTDLAGDVGGAVAGLGDATSDGGFSFPIFDDPADLFGYMVGQDIALVAWDAGNLEAQYTMELPPIFIPFGPVVVKVVFGGFVGAGGHLEVSYDTYGVRQALQADSFGQGFDAVLGGIVLEDYRDGQEVPEIYLETGVFVSGSLDLLVAEGGARGKLRGEIGFDLRDEDGKVRIQEIAAYFHRPLCLFEVNGLVEVILEVFAEIDLFLWDWEDSWEIVRFTLFEAKDILGDLCGGGQNPPDLATPVGDGVLRLNMGEDHAAARNLATGEPNEAFTVRQTGPGTVSVSAFGITQERTGVSRIVADAGTGEDVLEFLPGTPPAAGTEAATSVPFTIPVEVCLGPGADRAVGGNAVDEIHGDNGDVSGLDCDSGGASGGDVIDGGAGGDTITGGGGNDQIQGGSGEDTIDAGGDHDQVFGGPDHDTIDGGGGDDTLSGGPEPFDETGSGACDGCPTSQDDDRLKDTISGGPGDDTISGGFGHDTLNGDGDDDRIVGGPGDDTIDGGSHVDTIVGDEGDDTVNGGSGNDVIDGGPGDDDLYGDGDDDRIAGGPDNTGMPGDSDVGDLLEGGSGDDVLFGDDGDPTRPCTTGVGGAFAGEDTLRGGDGVDRLCGQGGGDVLEGDGHGDFLFGGAADDTLRGGDGEDEIHGEGGPDRVFGDADGDTIFGGDQDDRINGNDGNDEIHGGNGADRIDGDDDQDTIHGDAGADRIEGDANLAGLPDQLFGGGGDDLIVGGGSTTLSAPDAEDTIDGGGGHDRILGDNVTFGAGLSVASCLALPDGSFGGDMVTGGLGNDVITGQAGNDVLHGDAGNDLIFGELGNDEITGDDDFDTIFGDCATAVPTGEETPTGAPIHTIALVQHDAGGTDDIDGGDHDDDLHGGAATDTIRGGRGDDRIAGNGGADDVTGGLGADDIVGGTPVAAREDAEDPAVSWAPTGDRLLGGDGPDVIAGDNAVISRPLATDGTWRIDPVRGVTERSIQLLDVQLADGPDVPTTASGGDRIEGAVGPDQLFGQGGDDVVHGGTHQDLLEGNHGDDDLFGGSGPDDIIGGGSSDDGLITPTSVGDGLLDGADQIFGDGGVEGGPPSLSRDDVIAGDNARIVHPLDGASTAALQDPNRDALVSIVTLFDVETVGSPAADGTSGNEVPIVAGPGHDRVYGQGGDDVVDAGPGDDAVEGNHGDDTVVGGPGADDMVGGGSSNLGEVDDPDRVGDGLLDGQDTLYGDGDGPEDPATDGGDVVMGDNARVVRAVVPFVGTWLEDVPRDAPLRELVLFDVQLGSGPEIDPSTSAGETIIDGNAGNDQLFGQGGDDVVDAGSGDDYAEGNHGGDTITGGPDADDLIGGGASNTGVVGPTSVGDDLLDGADLVFGDSGAAEDAGDGGDVITGDNASIVRPTAATTLAALAWILPSSTTEDAWVPDPNRDDEAVRHVRLFDVEVVGGDARHPGVAAGDTLHGTGGADQLFGQGNLLTGDDDGDGRLDEDPADGIDNDRDGLESGASSGFDCLDGDDNDGDGKTDDADPDCQAAIDEDPGGDVLLGGSGDDVIEGNHGSDWLDGGPDQDDLIGGSSAGDGVIGGGEDPIDLADGDDVVWGQGDSDVALGDNGVIDREVDGDGMWQTLGNTFPEALAVKPSEPGTQDYETVVIRDATIAEDPQEAGAFGHDWMRAGAGHDEFIGQEGDDLIEGNAGDDVLVGDLGDVTTILEDGGRAEPYEVQQPFLFTTLWPAWSLTRDVTLFHHVDGDATDRNADQTLIGAEGDDVLLGGDGTDAVHGGPGDDLINGDGDGTSTVPDPDETTTDADHLWGGDGDDVIWGGRGPDDVFGGYGDDHVDVYPRPATDEFAGDPPEWFVYGRQDVFQGLDYIYGGWDQDAMQANLAETGPRVSDRLIDWVGAYNVYYVCDGPYGEGAITRALAPQVLTFLQVLSEARGAAGASDPTSSGGRETAIVFQKENRFNQQPVHPDHPGHFTCDGIDVLEGSP